MKYDFTFKVDNWTTFRTWANVTTGIEETEVSISVKGPNDVLGNPAELEPKLEALMKNILGLDSV